MALKIGTINVQGKVANQVRLGLPTDGSFEDGLVPLDENESVVDAIDALNEACGSLLDRVGWTRVVDVTNKAASPPPTYLDAPNNTILEAVSVTSTTFDMIIEAAYPKIEVNGLPATLPLVGTIYRGSVAVVLAESGPVVVETFDANGDPAAKDTVTVTLALPPTIQTAVFTGGYPGSQTELKGTDPISGPDSFNLQVTASHDFDRVIVEDFGACVAENIDVTPGASAIVAVTIADRGNSPQLLPARIKVRDAVTGGISDAFDTDSAGSVDGTNVVNLNNLHPTITWGVPTYPGSQQALKASESGAYSLSAITDLDTVLFDDAGTGEITITNPTTIEAVKTVQRIGGDYNVSNPNLRATGNRAANDASTIATTVMQIANVAPTIDILIPHTRLRSGGNNGTAVQDYTITMQTDQLLLEPPLMEADAGGNRGAFRPFPWAGGGNFYSRTFDVDETIPDEKGTFAWSGLQAKGLAGLIQNTVNLGANYTLGGFVKRDVSFQAFQTISDAVGVEIADFSKIQAGLWQASNNQSIRFPIGTSPPQVEGYTSQQAVGANPHNVEWLDTVRAGSSSGVSSLFDYEEIV